MKLRRTIKKGLSIVMSLALVFTLLLNVGVLKPKAAGFTMKIANIPVDGSSETGAIYYKNGDAGSFSGTASDYNAKLEWDANGITMTLNNLDMGFSGSTHVKCDDAIDMTIILVGDNTMYQGETYMGMLAAFVPIEMPNANLTIKGDGSLSLVCDNVTSTSSVGIGGAIGVNSLYITESATVDINVSKITSYSENFGICATSGLTLDGSASLDINMGSTQSLGNEYIGIKSNTTSSQVKVLGNSNLSITLGASTQGKTGIECYGFEATTSGNVTIDLGECGGGTYGINAKEFDVTDSTIDITVGDVGTNTSYGVFSEQNITLAGNANVQIAMNGGNWPNGIGSRGDLTMSDDASLDVSINSIDNYATCVDLYDITMSGDTVINVETEDPGQSSYGVGKTDSVITMSDNSTIMVALGDGTVESKGIIANKLDMSGNSVVDITAGNAPSGSYGLIAKTVDVKDNAVLTSLAGNASNTSDGKSYGIWATEASQVDSNAIVTATSGQGGMDAAAIQNTVAWEINGGYVEAISPAKAFNVAPTLAADKLFEVKAGANASSATAQTTTQKETDTTYTDNSYVLIRTLEPIDEVEVTDIDDIDHGDTPDAAATSATTGVSSNIPITWTPAGSAVGGTEYTATMVITPEDGYAFTTDTKVYVDGTAVTAALQDDGTLKATVKKTAQKIKLVSVTGPSGELVVDNGTALNNINFPGTVAISTDDGESDQVDVRWDLTNVNYDPTSEDEQVFTVTGAAVLPAYVNPGNVSTSVTVTVRVEAASTTSTTQEPTTQEPTTQEPTTQEPTTQTPTTQAPGSGSMTDTEAPTTAAPTTEAPDNSDANVKTGDSAPLNIILMLMVIASIGMVAVGKKKSE